VPGHSVSTDIFPNIQPKPALTQLEALPLVLSLVTWEKRPTPPHYNHLSNLKKGSAASPGAHTAQRRCCLFQRAKTSENLYEKSLRRGKLQRLHNPKDRPLGKPLPANAPADSTTPGPRCSAPEAAVQLQTEMRAPGRDPPSLLSPPRRCLYCWGFPRQPEERPPWDTSTCCRSSSVALMGTDARAGQSSRCCLEKGNLEVPGETRVQEHLRGAYVLTSLFETSPACWKHTGKGQEGQHQSPRSKGTSLLLVHPPDLRWWHVPAGHDPAHLR